MVIGWHVYLMWFGGCWTAGPWRIAAPAVGVVALHHRQKAASELGVEWRFYITKGSICVHSKSARMVVEVEFVVDGRPFERLLLMRGTKGEKFDLFWAQRLPFFWWWWWWFWMWHFGSANMVSRCLQGFGESSSCEELSLVWRDWHLSTGDYLSANCLHAWLWFRMDRCLPYFFSYAKLREKFDWVGCVWLWASCWHLLCV